MVESVRVNTLYILGNGFDIANDLKSQYDDYFESVFEDYPDYDSSGQALLSLEHELNQEDISRIPSAWFFIFAWYRDHNSDRDYRWEDIEEIIRIFIVPSDYWEKDVDNPHIAIDDFLEYLRRGTVWDFMKDDTTARKRTYDSLRLYYELNNNDVTKYSEKQVYKLFKEELDKLEIHFMSYLKEISKDEKYIRKCKTTLNKIIETEPVEESFSHHVGSLASSIASALKKPNGRYPLSFNYTEPFAQDQESQLPHTCMANLHGTLSEQNAVFGIDDVHFPERKSDSGIENIRWFFKDIRRRVKGKGEKLRKVQRMISDCDSIDIIKIFGCSLGDADYHYFKYYLNVAKIAEGNSKIGFYYTGKIREQLVMNVYSLFERYSRDMKLPDNLFQTLESSGRLEIESLD